MRSVKIGVAASEKTYKKRYKSAAREISYVAFSVALIAVCAWITIPVSAIPFTLQTLAVALAGGLLGYKRAVAAVAIYILMGLIGIPVFSGGQAGPIKLFGPTGGYIFGFLFLAFIPALFKKISLRRQWARFSVFFAAMIFGETVCYVFGTAWFLCVNNCSLGYALLVCVVPFIVPDLVKFALAAFLTVKLERYIK